MKYHIRVPHIARLAQRLEHFPIEEEVSHRGGVLLIHPCIFLTIGGDIEHARHAVWGPKIEIF